MQRRGGGPWEERALGREPSSFVLGHHDELGVYAEYSWQEPSPRQEREKVDKHQRSAVSSDHSIRALLSAWGRPKWGISAEKARGR